MNYTNKINESVAYLQNLILDSPTLGLVLGSGLGSLSDRVEERQIIHYKDIPHFPVSTVAGHAGSLLFGKVLGMNVVFMQGRFHYYEGYSMREVVFPYYVLKALGVNTMILTNACGGINPSYTPGDIVVVEDFINLVIQNPLIGFNDDNLGPRFPDMTEPYDLSLISEAKKIANDLNIPFKTGVYGFFSGPYYETRAEIRAYGRLGCDLIGMSTVPETIALNHMGVRTIAFSVVTNMATGIQDKKHDHAHVVKMAQQASETLSQWLDVFIQNRSKEQK